MSHNKIIIKLIKDFMKDHLRFLQIRIQILRILMQIYEFHFYDFKPITSDVFTTISSRPTPSWITNLSWTTQNRSG